MCLTEEANGIICLGCFLYDKFLICLPQLKYIQIHVDMYIWYIDIIFLLQCWGKRQEPHTCQGSSAARYLQPSRNLFSPLVTIKLSLLFRYHSCLHISILAPAVPLLLFLALFAKTFLGKCVFPLINHVIRVWLFWLFPGSDRFGCFVCTLALS